jgi:PAS domain S-box-containing protein
MKIHNENSTLTLFLRKRCISDLPMNIFPARVIVPTLLLHLFFSLSAQDNFYRCDLISNEHGLSNTTVSSIVKDSYGFVWFGTWNGLNRYDGYELKTFHYNALDTNTLSNNRINTLFLDDEGLLWIGTDEGLNSHDPKTGKFRRFRHPNQFRGGQANDQINAIIQDRAGNLWIGTQDCGLHKFNKTTGSFTSYLNTHSARSNAVYCLLADNQNPDLIWVGTAAGLFLFEKGYHSFVRLGGPSKDNILSVQALSQDMEGNLYLGTWGSGLLKYNRKTRNIQSCTLHSTPVRTAIIRNLVPFGENLLVVTRDKGLFVYNTGRGDFEAWQSGSFQECLKELGVMSLYHDPSGILWVGTSFDGVVKMVPLINRFAHIGYKSNYLPPVDQRGGITAILEDSKGYLWLGTQFGGLYQIDRKGKTCRVYKKENTFSMSLSGNHVLSIMERFEANKQEIWVGTDGDGLNRLDPANGKIKVYRKKGNLSGGPSSNSISSILSYDDHHLILGTWGSNMGEGLDIFDLKTEKFLNLRFEPDYVSSPSSNAAHLLFKDHENVIWIGTRNGGVNKLVIRNIHARDPHEVGDFTRYMHKPDSPYSIPSNSVHAIHEDRKHNLWISTNHGGLCRFDRSKGQFFRYSSEAFTENTLIYGIQSDDHGILWLSASTGIIAFNHVSGEAHRFDRYDGLVEKSFIQGSAHQSERGELFFGGLQGCSFFFPDSISIQIRVPKIVITSIIFKGKNGSTDITGITGLSAFASKKIRVPYWQNDFFVSFAALDFQAPAKIKYKYRLSGYSNDFVETHADQRFVNYTNLPPGRYLFTVIGSNNHDVWNHAGSSIEIFIAPPFWKAGWFLWIVSLLIVSGASLALLTGFKKYALAKKQLEEEAMAALKDERWQLQALIDTMPDAVYVKDRNCRFLLANKQVGIMLKAGQEGLIGKSDFDFFSKEVAQSYFEKEQEVIRTGKPIIDHEGLAFDKQGNRAIMSTTKLPYRNQSGEIIGIMGVCKNITRLKRIEDQLRKKSEDLQEANDILEERQEEILFQSEELASQTQNLRMINTELERLNRTKDKFFSIIAHDLRNPFNAIIGFSSLLKNDYHELDDREKLNLLDLINVSSETAFNLLENLLQWARTQTNRIAYEPESFNLHELVSSNMNLHAIMAQKKQLILQNQVGSDLFVYADKNMINTVLRNLISNAIKFSEPEGVVRVNATEVNDQVEVSVADTGVGMNNEGLSKLFRIDTYYSTSGTQGESGTGLGLIICKEFVEKNNGRIKASSTPGKGTTMTFSISSSKLN